MTAFLLWLKAFWIAYGPWVLTILIPSIITALLKVPNPQANKAGNFIKHIFDFFSLLTHKDAPGTMQLPFKLRKLTNGVKPPSTPTALILIFALGVGASGCAAWSSFWGSGPGKDAQNALIDCTKETVLTTAPQLLPAIKAIIHGDTATWKAQLKAFVKEFGKDIVACAVRQVTGDIFSSLPPQGTEPTADQRMMLDDLTRARAFTNEQGWKFAPEEK